jgi:hypothetical protein
MLRLVVIPVIFILVTFPCHAAVKTIGKGEGMRLDTAGFPPDMKSAYVIMQTKCTRCHSMERTLMAVTSGVAPISGRPFDRVATNAYGQKMLRKQNAQMNSDEVKAVVDLLNYLLDNMSQKRP